MLKRLAAVVLLGLMVLCGTTGILLGLLAIDQLAPPQFTGQIGPLLVSSIPPCSLDQAVHSPCLLPGSDVHWLVRLEIQNPIGQSQQWTLYGGGHGSLRLVHR
jgi:hypothetical protein